MLNKRFSGRNFDQLRDVKITRRFTNYADGAVLIELGNTRVICTATIDENLPVFLKNSRHGWITAEYAMLPSSTHTRNKRDGVAGKVAARSQEISRLIGRSLRACVDLEMLGARQIIIDCDVIQADGGTRVASITGAFVALYDAINKLIAVGKLTVNPIKQYLAAISVGIYQQVPMLDLDYSEDSGCDSDLNVVMFEDGAIVEIQGTAEKMAIKREELNKLLDLAAIGITQLIKEQKNVLTTDLVG